MKEYKVTLDEFDLPVTIKVMARITPEVPMSRHYPGDPPMIEEVVITEVYGYRISEELSDLIYRNHEKEIDKAIWDKVNSEMNKMYEQWAADSQDEADYLRDIRKNR